MQLIKIMNEAQQGSSDNIIEKNVREIKGKTGEKLKEEMLYPGKFTELWRPETPYHTQLLEDSTSVIHPPQKIPVAIRSRLKKKLVEMEILAS